MEKRYELTEKQALRDPWKEVVEMCFEAWGDIPDHADLDFGYEMHLANGKSYYEYLALSRQGETSPVHPGGLQMCLRMMLHAMRRSHGSVKWIPGDPVKYLLFVRPAEERPEFVRAVKETA